MRLLTSWWGCWWRCQLKVEKVSSLQLSFFPPSLPPPNRLPSTLNFLFTSTHLLKCVFRLRLSSIFGCNLPICSSSFDNVFVRFFFSFCWACSFDDLLCRRLLKNRETLRSSTVPELGIWLSMLAVVVVVIRFPLSLFQRTNWNFLFFYVEWKNKGRL